MKLAELLKQVPAGGLQGDALREAKAGDFRDIAALVRDELGDVLNPNPGDSTVYVEIEALFTDSVVIRKDNRLYSYSYTIDDNNEVQLGQPVEVVKSFAQVNGADVMQPQVAAAFAEAAGDAPGTVWECVIIEAGTSGNGVVYSEQLLRESAPMFDGVRVFLKSDKDHLNGDGKDAGKLIGWIDQPRFVEAKAGRKAHIAGRLNLLVSETRLREALVDMFKRGKPDLVGLSIDALGAARMERRDGRVVRIAESFGKILSVDLIVEPGAGGRLIRLVESFNPQEEHDMKLRDSMLRLLEAQRSDLYEKIDPNNITDEALEQLFREALAGAPEKTSVDAPAGVSKDELAETVRMVEARAYARTAIAGSNLPDAAKSKLTTQISGMERFTEAQVDEIIGAEREYLAKFTESGKVNMGGLDIEAGEDRADKVGQMLDDFFEGKMKSFRECYSDITGDLRVTGHLEDCDMRRLRESMPLHFREALTTASFANVLGSSLNRRMVAEYNRDSVYDVWRYLTGQPVPLNDFRTNERTRFGGYGDLSTVAEGDPYPALTSPTDEKASYAAAKRGGTESVTLEMVRNDDVGAIRRIPVRMTSAAKRTLAKFVLDFLATNPTIYDATALFTAGHGNLGSAALDATSLAARRLAMLKQTELGSGDRLGIGPRNLWVPADLETTAVDLFNRNTNLDKTAIQSLSLNVIPVWYWTDTNNWFLSADPMDIPTVEIGFLDGKEEPELFVQDVPNQGSLFSNDKITYKQRHIYGGNVLDYRGLDGSIVA